MLYLQFPGFHFQMEAANFLWGTDFVNHSFYLYWDKEQEDRFKTGSGKGIMAGLRLKMGCEYFYPVQMGWFAWDPGPIFQQLDFWQPTIWNLTEKPKVFQMISLQAEPWSKVHESTLAPHSAGTFFRLSLPVPVYLDITQNTTRSWSVSLSSPQTTVVTTNYRCAWKGRVPQK